jgi:GTPase
MIYQELKSDINLKLENKHEFYYNLDTSKYDLDTFNNIISDLNLECVSIEKDNKYLIRKEMKDNNYIDLKICVSGNVDSGKSTTIGVLTSGDLDNGRGKTRAAIFNYPHERESGRSSSVALEIMGYKSNGDIYIPEKQQKKSWPNIIKNSSKIVTFYDLCGHEKYLKTTIYGLSLCDPDFTLVMVGANMGITHMTKEHIFACMALKIPFIVIITKIDLCPANILKQTEKDIIKLVKTYNSNKIIKEIKESNDIVNIIDNINDNKQIPLLKISNVSGRNVDNLKKFLNLLPKRKNYNSEQKVEFLIDKIYQITGCGTVFSGLLKSGKVKVGDILHLGPDKNSNYIEIKIRSIQCKKIPIEEAVAGYYVCFGIKKINKKLIIKGMVLVSNENKLAVRTFWANVVILKSHSTTIRLNYQPMMHINNIRQCAKIIEIANDKNVLNLGDKTRVKFKFVSRPVYINSGDKIIFREGRLRGIGNVE